MAWHYDLTNPGPFAVIRSPELGPDGQWQKNGVDVPLSRTGQTTFHRFPVTAAEGASIGIPADDYLMVGYETDPLDEYPWLNQAFSIGQGQDVYPQHANLIDQIMDTVNVASAAATINAQVATFNNHVAEFNADHGTSHPPLDVTGDISWVDAEVADLPPVFGYKIAYFAAGFGYSPKVFTRDYVAPWWTWPRSSTTPGSRASTTLSLPTGTDRSSPRGSCVITRPHRRLPCSRRSGSSSTEGPISQAPSVSSCWGVGVLGTGRSATGTPTT
ncbi:MAG: hypothetical protein GY679_00840, partial [Mycoplasma sp.]|nr:hypothetical protein [Mycoplasma sp.]